MPGRNRNENALIPWLTPMAAARGPLRNLGVWQSYLVHLAGLLLFVLGVAVFDAACLQSEIRKDIVDAVRSDPAMGLFFYAVTFLPIQLAFILFAWLTTCWGAGVEPYRESFNHSLSRWCQLTPWLALLGLGLILAFYGIDQIENWYWNRYYDARWGDYYDIHTEPMMLLTRERFELLLNLGRFGSLGIANLIFLWWALGTVMVHRGRPTWPASCRWPAVCEGCGYALAGLVDEQTCPECGKSVGQSKHSDRGKQKNRSLWMLWRGLLTPSAVGAEMLTRQPTKQPLRVLLWGLLFTVFSGPAMMILSEIGLRIKNLLNSGFYFGGTIEGFGDILENIVMIGLTTGIYSAMFGCLLLLGAGTIVGTLVRVTGKQNIMPAACAAACYSAALLPVWVLTQGVLAIVIIPLTEYLRVNNRYNLADILPLIFLVFNGFMIIYTILHIAHITKSARYANV